jgi:hypothetical protein
MRWAAEPEKMKINYFTEGWVGSRAGLYKYEKSLPSPHQDPIPGPFIP